MSENKEVTIHQPTFMDLIAQNVNSPDFDAAKLNALIDANIRVNKIQAEIEFNEAMARLQPKLPQITRNAKGHNSQYATYEYLDKIVRPLYTEEGFNISFDTKGQTHFGTITHKNGHFKTAQIDFSPDKSGNKNDIQAIISALSYAKRNLVQMLLNVVTTGEDNDGENTPITTEQAVEIDQYIKNVGMNKDRFLKTLKVEDVRDIRTRDYNRALNSLKAKELDNLKKERQKIDVPLDDDKSNV